MEGASDPGSLAFWHPLFLSLQIAILAALACAAVGLPLAWVLARKRFLGRRLVEVLVTLPLVVPPTVTGWALLVFLSTRSPFGAFLETALGITFVFDWKGAWLAATVGSLPLFVRPARAALEDVDAALERQARLLGRRPLDVFVRVTLPLARRGLGAGLVLAFARALGDFGASLVVAGSIPFETRTVSMAIYDAIQAQRDSDAAILVLVTVLVAVTLILFAGGTGRAPRVRA